MRKRIILIMALAASAAFSAGAQTRFFSEAEVQYIFDNHEFDPSGRRYLNSETIQFVRCTPRIGWRSKISETLSQKLTVGVDIVDQIGQKQGGLRNCVEEVPVWYTLDHQTATHSFRSVFGVYPRSLVRGTYSELILSEEIAQSDFNLDGMLLQYGRDHFFAELGLDWMGKYSQTTRERFQIYSYGKFAPWDFFGMGWSASMFHFAGSVEAPGVVDNHIAQLYAIFDAGSWTPFDKLSAKFSGYYGYQNDRVAKDLRMAKGAELELKVQYGGLGARNLTALTDDFQPFFNTVDKAGNQYGTLLYRGSQLYRGMYDLMELYWMPQISDSVHIKVNFRFHWLGGEGFLGSEQRVSLLLNL